MIFSLDIRRARKGDCLLLHFGSPRQPGLALIDGGPGNVYAPQLKPRLRAIRTARRLDERTPLMVDLLMVSHADDDHIHGILDLTRDMLDRRAKRQAPLLRGLDLWYNTFDDILAKDAGKLTAAVTAQFGAAALDGELPADVDLDAVEDDEVVQGNLQVLASIGQGHRLCGDAEALDFSRNRGFADGLILAATQGVPIGERLDGEFLEFVVAGPMQPELEELRKKHGEWLNERREAEDDATAALAAYVDKSVTNLSSLVALVRFAGKTILLTGDARGDKILAGLELVGLLERSGTMQVDVLKVPHHGSSNNLSSDFFARIRADHYVISGNGEHGNPERETMAMLFAARRKEPFDLHLTYPIAEIDAAREAEWEKEQAKERRRRAARSKRPLRPDWSAPEHGLAAFFEQTPLATGQAVHVVSEKEPHVIDLLDPLGF